MVDSLFAGRYEILETVGQGAVGVVHRVRDRLEGHELALKVCQPEADPGLLRGEYRLLHRLSHPNLPEAYRLGRDATSGLDYFTMEFCAGLSWDTWARAELQGSIDEERLGRVAAQLVRVLGHLHDSGYAHGDVTPGNVLVSESGRLVLIDLGMASGGEGGTLKWAAPERLAGGSPTPAADWFGVGLLLATALWGEHPYPEYPARRTRAELRTSGASGLRRALLPVVERLISLEAADRKFSAGQLLEELSACFGVHFEQLPAEVVARRVERVTWTEPSPELARLRDTMLSPSGDESEVAAFVHGAQGTGKTRLVDELVSEVESRGWVAALVRCRPGESSFAVVRRILAQLDGELGGAWESDLVAGVADQVRALRQGFDPKDSGGELVASADRAGDRARERARRIDAIAQALAHASASRSVLIAVDDAEELDPESSKILAALIRTVEARSGAERRLHVVLTGTTPWAEGGVGASTPLPPMAESQVRAFVDRLFVGRRADREIARRLVARSAGIPVLMVATLREWAATGALRVGAHEVTLDESAASAALDSLTAVSEWLERGVETVRPDAKRVLFALHALRRDVSPQALAFALELELVSVRREVAELIARGWVRRTDRGQSVHYGLPSGVRRALESRVRPEGIAPRTLHARVADFLEGDSSEEASWAVAFHRLRANEGAVGDDSAALRRAVSRRVDTGRYSDVLWLLDSVDLDRSSADWQVLHRRWEWQAALALSLFERAAAAVERSAAISRNPEERVEAEMAAGIVAFRRGRYGESSEHLERAAEEHARETSAGGEVQLARIESWLSQARLFEGSYAEAKRVADAAAGRIDRSGAEAAPEVRTRLARTRGLAAYYQGELVAAMDWFREALARAEAQDDPIATADAIGSIALVHQRTDRMNDAVEAYERALAVFEETGDRSRQWATLMNLGVVQQERGDYGGALESYAHSLRIAESIGDTGGEIRNHNNLGNAHRYLGELEAARAHVSRSLALAEKAQDRFMQGYNLALLGEIASAEGARATAESRLSQSMELFDSLGCANEVTEVRLELARHRLDFGQIDEARRLALESAGEARSRGGGHVLAKALTLAAEAESRLADGDLEAAGERLDEAERVAKDVVQPEARWPLFLARARAAREAGEIENATEAGLKALDILRSIIQGLPAEHRAAYVAISPRREAMAELRWVEAMHRAAGRLPANRPAAAAPTLSKLLEINKRLSTEHDLVRLLEFIMDSAILLTGAERGFLLLRDSGAERGMRIKVARNFDRENIRNVKFKISRGIAERVLEQGEPVVTVDAMEDERYREHLSIHSLRLRSVLCVPMRGSNGTLGVLYLDNRFQVSAFGEDELQFMEAFADQGAIAIGNARLMEEKDRARVQLEASQKEVAALNQKLSDRLTATEEALAQTRTRVERQQRQLEGQHRYDNIVGQSGALRSVLYVVERVLDNAVPVLVTGESGTGKELIARAIHYNGSRNHHEFVPVNCGSIPTQLFESELFGHVRGSFTGATRDKDGLFEVANRGTLFLDEIGELPLDTQVKLLRVLQSGEIQKVGSTKVTRVDVRILAATNRDLKKEVAEKRFREDLYYRLNVVPIVLPPLRSRAEDVPLLVQHFIRKNRESGLTQVSSIDRDALALLSRYPWPGNIRELDTVMKNASVFAEGEHLTVRDFAHIPELMGMASAPTRAPDGDSLPATSAFRVGMSLADMEREAIVQTLEALGGNKKRTAEVLGIDRRTLYNKLSAYEIRVEKRAKVIEPSSK